MTRAPIRQAVLSIKIDGKEMAARWAPRLLSTTVHLEGSGKSDSCEFVFDDRGGRLALPRAGAKAEVSIAWDEGAPAIRFEGKTDEPTCEISRGGGMTLSLNANAVDMKGKAKQKRSKHKDNSTLKEAATEFGQAAGFTVTVDGAIGAIRRPWWAMDSESFLAWGARIAEEVGGIFKAQGDKAIIAPRGDGKSAGGKALATLSIARGVNLISGKLTPRAARRRYKKVKVRRYDRDKAKYVHEEIEVADSGAEATLEDGWKSGDADQAKARAKANGKDAEAKKGGGDVTIRGDAAALPGAPAEIKGWRSGVDGAWKVAKASHSVSRAASWESTVTLEKPNGDTG